MDKTKIIKQAEKVEECFESSLKNLTTFNAKECDVKVEKKCEIDEFKKKFPDAIFIEPKQKSKIFVKRDPKLDEQAALRKDYERVVGIFESAEEYKYGIEFWLNHLPGDDLCLWKIPSNTPCIIPRYVARHLEESLCFKQPRAAKNASEIVPNPNFSDLDQYIQQVDYKKVGSFHPIQSY